MLGNMYFDVMMWIVVFVVLDRFVVVGWVQEEEKCEGCVVVGVFGECFGFGL